MVIVTVAVLCVAMIVLSQSKPTLQPIRIRSERSDKRRR